MHQQQVTSRPAADLKVNIKDVAFQICCLNPRRLSPKVMKWICSSAKIVLIGSMIRLIKEKVKAFNLKHRCRLGEGVVFVCAFQSIGTIPVFAEAHSSHICADVGTVITGALWVCLCVRASPCLRVPKRLQGALPHRLLDVCLPLVLIHHTLESRSLFMSWTLLCFCNTKYNGGHSVLISQPANGFSPGRIQNGPPKMALCGFNTDHSAPKG